MNNRKINILLIEDNYIGQRVATLVFKMLKYDYDLVETGADAFVICEQKRFDIIFTDVSLPDTMGPDIARKLRKQKGLNSEVPIVALTAQMPSSFKKKCLRSGMNHFLEKPLTYEKISEMLTLYVPWFIQSPIPSCDQPLVA